MDAKEKAEYLIRKHLYEILEAHNYDWGIKVPDIDIMFNSAKKCALVTVDVILNSRPGYPYPYELDLEIQGLFNIIHYPEKYWNEVNEEINKCDGKKWKV